MPLEILGALVVAGIGGIALLLHLLGLSRPARFDDAESALRAWLREFPDSAAPRAEPLGSGSAAIVEDAEGPGLVWAMGADSVARRLSGARVLRAGPGRLRLGFADYAAPAVTLQVTEAEAARLRGLIEREEKAA